MTGWVQANVEGLSELRYRIARDSGRTGAKAKRLRTGLGHLEVVHRYSLRVMERRDGGHQPALRDVCRTFRCRGTET